MKKFKILLVLVIIGGGIFAYYQHKEVKRQELMTYINETWVPTMAESEGQLQNFTDKLEKYEENDEEQKIVDLMEEKFLPISQEIITQLQEVNPKNKEIEKLNQKTIETEKSRKKVFQLLKDYKNGQQSVESPQSAREDVSDKAEEATDYKQELMDKYNLERDSKDKIEGFEKVKRK